MKYSNEIPPIYEKLRARFPNANWDNGLFIAYGDTIYGKEPPTKDLFVHEMTHLDRQTDPEEWYEKYLNDDEFRLDEEVLAYQNQLDYLKQTTKDRNKLFKIKEQIVNVLTSLYDLNLTKSEARELLK